MSKTEIAEILVLGSTGKIGRRITQQLRDRGISVRAASRTGDIVFDWNNSETWREAIGNADKVFLMTPDETVDVEGFLEIAADTNVKRIVGLSGRKIQELDLNPLRVLDDALRASSFDWTIVQANNFNQNFTEGDTLPQIMAGTIIAPIGNVGEPFVDANDVAAVVVEALTATTDQHVKQVYEVTGNRSISFAEAAEIISKSSGRSVSFMDMEPTAYRTLLNEHGVPSELADFLDLMYEFMRSGAMSTPTNDIQRVLGRDPITFEDSMSDAARSGAWSD